MWLIEYINRRTGKTVTVLVAAVTEIDAVEFATKADADADTLITCRRCLMGEVWSVSEREHV